MILDPVYQKKHPHEIRNPSSDPRRCCCAPGSVVVTWGSAFQRDGVVVKGDTTLMVGRNPKAPNNHRLDVKKRCK